MAEHNKKLDKHAHSESGRGFPSGRGTIIFPGLDGLLFTPRQHDIIWDLKSKNDFRYSALYSRMYKLLFLFIICFVSSLFLFYAASVSDNSSIDSIIINNLIAGVIFLLPIVFLLFSRKSPWIVMSVGGVCDGEIENIIDRRYTLVHGIHIEYKYKVNNNNYNGNFFIQKYFFDGKFPDIGDFVYIFYDIDSVDKSILFTPYVFNKNCLSIKMYEYMKNKYFVRVK